MRNVAVVAIVALVGMGLGFYAGVQVGESRATGQLDRETAATPRSDDAAPQLQVVGGDGARLFATARNALYESRDAGRSWTRVGDAEDLRAHPWKLLNEK